MLKPARPRRLATLGSPRFARGPSTLLAGFTLLELLVVLVIFGIFAVMAYGGLSSVLNARRRIEDSLARISEYQKAYQRLRDDFTNGSGRTVRDSDGNGRAVLLYDTYNKRLEFTRGGWSNPALLPRATLERVSYFIDDTHSDNYRLIRRSWRVLDRASHSEPVDLSLLEHVEGLQWRFLDRKLAWQTQWPAANASLSSSGDSSSIAPPVAVEMTLSTRDWGELRYLFRFGAEGTGCWLGAPGSSSGAGIGSSSGGESSSSSGAGIPGGNC
jgi:general secretion pathway protein J